MPGLFFSKCLTDWRLSNYVQQCILFVFMSDKEDKNRKLSGRGEVVPCFTDVECAISLFHSYN